MSGYERLFVCRLSMFAERTYAHTHTRKHWANMLNLHTNACSHPESTTESDR